MSYRIEKVMSLTGMEILGKSTPELLELFDKLIKRGTHGLCISPYEEGQKPGDQLTEEQIVRRLDIIKPHTKWIRSFSCTDGNELIPRIAKEKGFNTLVGAWLGTDAEVNRREIESAIQLAKEGLADIVAVGNEVLYRGDLSEQELLEFILHVKQEIPDIPVGYVDAYYEFEFRPEITEACDVILANCYPFWEGCSQEYSLLYMKDMYNRAVRAGNGKKVIITETSWKTDSEGDVGSTWGLWDFNEQLKF